MDIRPLTPRYAVSPQISPEDCAQIRESGFVAVICNRPDAEIPPSHWAAQMQAAAEQAGLAFHDIPLTHQTLTDDKVTALREIVAQTDGPVLAYCASGTRSSILWALSQAGTLSADDILGCAAEAGYDLSGLRGALSG